MILGEGAAVCCLEIREKRKKCSWLSLKELVMLQRFWNISISAEATCFKIHENSLKIQNYPT
jgi:hypothetical protein